MADILVTSVAKLIEGALNGDIDEVSDFDNFDDLEFILLNDKCEKIDSNFECFMLDIDYEVEGYDEFYGYLNSGNICVSYLNDKYGFDIPKSIIDEINSL